MGFQNVAGLAVALIFSVSVNLCESSRVASLVAARQDELELTSDKAVNQDMPSDAASKQEVDVSSESDEETIYLGDDPDSEPFNLFDEPTSPKEKTIHLSEGLGVISSDSSGAEDTESESEKPDEKAKHGGKSTGGHDGGIRIDGAILWKKKQGKGRGESEEKFLKEAMDEPVLSKFVPKYEGVKVDLFGDDDEWIGMTNLLYGLKDPAMLDLKMGNKTWDSRATPEKIKKASKKLKGTTTESLGIRVIAGKMQEGPGDEWEKLGKLNDKDVDNKEEMQDVLSKFLRTPHLRKAALEKVNDLLKFFSTNKRFAFAASSLLLAYDSAEEEPQDLRFSMIDFAHVDDLEGKALDEHYLFGLRNLQDLLTAIVEEDIEEAEVVAHRSEAEDGDDKPGQSGGHSLAIPVLTLASALLVSVQGSL